MKNQKTYDKFTFDAELLEEQKELVISMTSKIVSSQFKVKQNKIRNLCLNAFLNNEVFESFKKLLSSHGVTKKTIYEIENGFAFGELSQLKEFPIYSHKTGVIKKINQKNIGNFVNMELEAGTNYFYIEKRLYDGVLIRRKIKSKINKDEPIASVYSLNDIDTSSLSNIFFNIS